jgi:hypothetical protein
MLLQTVNLIPSSLSAFSSHEIDVDNPVCPKCNYTLEIYTELQRERKECRACDLGVFSRSCDCTYYESMKTIVKCSNCNKCHCGLQRIQGICDTCKCNKCGLTDAFDDGMCKKCILRDIEIKKQYELEKNKFANKWQDNPLTCYGKTKLMMLAKRKEVKKYSCMSKSELIEHLRPLIIPGDLPIK